MIYDLKKVVRTYIRGFDTFIKKKGIANEDPERLYELFSNSISNIYGLDSSEYNNLVHAYGTECQEELRSLKGVPKNPSKMSLSDKVSISLFCKSYFAAITLLSNDAE